MPSASTPPPPLHAESTRDGLDWLGAGIARLEVREERPEPQHRGTQTVADLARQLLSEKMLAKRWSAQLRDFSAAAASAKDRRS